MKPTHNVVMEYTRPEYGPKVRFIKVYTVAVQPGQDLKEIFARAFKAAYPERILKDIDVQPA